MVEEGVEDVGIPVVVGGTLRGDDDEGEVLAVGD